MPLTQLDINNIVNNLVNELTPLGHVAFPDGRYPGECTAPIAWYMERLGAPLPAMVNNRADGWGVDFPLALAPHFTHETYQAGKQYPKGTLLIWNSPHIAIVLACDGSNVVEVFEQNADPDGMPCGIHNRVVNNQFHTCTYALVPILAAPAPAPQPVPVVTLPPNGASTADSPVYRPIVVPVQGYSNATAAANHDPKFQGLDVQPGSHYFLFTTKYGMDNVTLVSGEPGAWINPADNVLKPIVITPPEPVAVPEPAPLPPPEDDDVTKWKASYASLRNDGKMVKYVLLHDLTISDLSGKAPDMHLRKYQEIGIYGTFVKDQVKYWRPKLAKDTHFDLWYGIKLMDENGEPTMEEEQLIYNADTTVAERKALHTTRRSDIPVVAIGTVERFLEDGVKVIDGFIAKARKKVRK